jgi:hypothetical protein
VKARRKGRRAFDRAGKIVVSPQNHLEWMESSDIEESTSQTTRVSFGALPISAQAQH